MAQCYLIQPQLFLWFAIHAAAPPLHVITQLQQPWNILLNVLRTAGCGEGRVTPQDGHECVQRWSLQAWVTWARDHGRGWIRGWGCRGEWLTRKYLPFISKADKEVVLIKQLEKSTASSVCRT